VRLNYEFALKQNNMVISTMADSKTATLSDMSTASRTETDTTMMEWYAKASIKAEAHAGYPEGFGASVSVTAEAGVGAAGKNEVTSTTAKQTVDAYNQSNKSGRMLQSGQTEERSVTGATVSADVRFINTGPLSMSLDNILVRMRMPDPGNPGEFITIGTLDAQGLNAPLELGTLTTMREVPFSKSLDGRGPEFVDALMRNPRSIIFDVSNFRLKSPPSDPNSYVEKEASIVANTAEVTVDFAGDGDRPVQQFFVSSNLGRQEAVRDRNGDGQIDAADAERVIYRPPNGEYLYPRLTEALAIRGFDFTVDPVTGQFTSISGVANDLVARKAWIVVVADDSGTVTMTPLATFNPKARVEDVPMKPGLQVWVSYMQDFDGDLVPRSAESLYGTSDADTDSDDDGLDDYQEIFGSAAVTVTGPSGQQTTFTSRSNPILADSDADGLSDLRERNETHTASDRADTDGDGVSDADEVDVDHTDPLDARDFKCRPHQFRFDVTSINEPDIYEGDYYWNGGTETQSTSGRCSVTIQRPRGSQSGGCNGLVFGVIGFGGFSQCRGVGGTEGGGCQVTSCPNPQPPPLGAFCHAQGLPVPPTCPQCLQVGRSAAVASYFVQCD
jgi:Bacterial TSP3 repeat